MVGAQEAGEVMGLLHKDPGDRKHFWERGVPAPVPVVEAPVVVPEPVPVEDLLRDTVPATGASDEVVVTEDVPGEPASDDDDQA